MADQESLKWRQALASALKGWLGRSTYDSPTAFARDNGIEESTLRRILRAENVPGAETCAKIFLTTGLDEADPRKIPDLIRVSPRGAKGYHTRAWTEAQYQSWLKKQSVKGANERTAAATGFVSGTTPGTAFDALFFELQATRTTVEKLTKLLQPATADLAEVDLLAQKLRQHLDKAILGNAADRDRFQSRYGETLSTLLSEVDALTRTEREDRERAAARVREMGEVTL